MSGFLEDRAVAERVLRHIDEGSTDRGDVVWREPVANYRSEERLEAELRVLRRSPLAFCPSAALPEAGSYVARESAGTPIFAVRGRDGRVRAFRNACRHRGMQIASGSGCKQAFVCPYHGWTYQLDGSLKHVPHEDGFPGLDRAAHGLVPVTAEERLGLVFVTQEGGAEAASSLDGLPTLFAPEQELLASSEAEVDVNWKVYLEGFIEGYHIKPTHPESFYPYGFDNLNVIEHAGPHSRVTYPFRRIEKLRDVPPEDRHIEGLVTYVYHLFPNAVVTVLSRHTNLVVLEPTAVGRTRAVFYKLTNPGGGEEARKLAERDATFVSDNGAAEDLAVVKAIQASIGSGANEHFTFGHFEPAIVHFHRTLREALARDVCGELAEAP
jgi:phenylpropionate dioxygenase-like ring-hydroxylating dioxygenase large terminal subunit